MAKQRPSYQKALEIYALNMAEADFQYVTSDMTLCLLAQVWNHSPEKVAEDAARVRLENGFEVENWPSAEGDE